MRLLIAVALLSFVFTGCRKDCIKPDDTIPPLAPRPPQPMIKTASYTDHQGNTNSVHYYYDSLWRLQVRVSERTTPSPSTYIDTFKYSYPYIYVNNLTYYILNADSLVYQDRYTSWYSQKTYTFNSNRNQVHVSSMVGSDTRTYDSNYNMVEKHSNVEANPPNRIYTDNYYTYNTHINTIGNYNTGEYHFGKASVNLIEHEDSDWYLNVSDSLMDFAEYTYGFNDSGWVSRLDTRRASVSKRYIDSVNFVIDTNYNNGTQEFTYY